MSDHNDSQRKASDILLSLEQKIDNVIKLISVYDLNSKLTLNAINNVYKLLTEEVPVDEPTISTDPVKNLQLSPSPTLPQRNRLQPEVEKSIVKNESETTQKQVPVEQRVVDNKGKDLFMAEVIISAGDKQIKKLKTSAVGKWQCHLQPGTYSVYICKTDSSSMKKIDCTQEINVSDNIKSLTLPTAIINRG